MDELSLYFSSDTELREAKTRLKKSLPKLCSSRPVSLCEESLCHANILEDIEDGSSVSSSRPSENKSMHLNPDLHFESNRAATCNSMFPQMPRILPPEIEEGNIEYKRKLVDPTPIRFEHLVTQMKWRLNEGRGKAVYKLGVDDDGRVKGLSPLELADSLKTIELMAKRLNATIHFLRERVIELPNSRQSECQKAVELLICQAPSANQGSPDLCIAVLGGVDSGKSTLIGVLTDGELDNGRGKARLNLFRHLHEVQSGRTSSLSSALLGFDSNGVVTNYVYNDNQLCRRSMDEILTMSTYVITLLDLAGHHKYQRTTLSGLASNQPVGVLLSISAVTGLNQITLDHAQLILTLQLPAIIVITRADQLPNHQHQLNMEKSKRIHAICDQLVYYFNQIQMTNQRNLVTNKSTFLLDEQRSNILHKNYKFSDYSILPPLFVVSNVTGFGTKDLIQFLSRLGRPSPADYPLLILQESVSDSSAIDKSSPPNVTRLNSASNVPIQLSKELKIQCVLNRINTKLNYIKSCQNYSDILFWISQIFTRVPGVYNPILVGRLQTGRLRMNQIVWFGPDKFGDFYAVQIVSLMHNRQPHYEVYAGQSASLAIHFLPKQWIQLSCLQQFELSEAISSDYLNATKFSSENVNCFKNKTTESIVPIDLLLRRGLVIISTSLSLNQMIHLPPLHVPNISLCKSHNLTMNYTIGSVVWQFTFTLTYYLPSISFKCNSSNPQLPCVGQRVNVYAGCVFQTCIISSIDNDNTDETVTQKSKDSQTHLHLRFTRHPEFLEIGRQILLTWNRNWKLLGFVSHFEDQPKHVEFLKSESFLSLNEFNQIIPDDCIKANFVEVDSPVLSKALTLPFHQCPQFCSSLYGSNFLDTSSGPNLSPINFSEVPTSKSVILPTVNADPHESTHTDRLQEQCLEFSSEKDHNKTDIVHVEQSTNSNVNNNSQSSSTSQKRCHKRRRRHRTKK